MVRSDVSERSIVAKSITDPPDRARVLRQPRAAHQLAARHLRFHHQPQDDAQVRWPRSVVRGAWCEATFAKRRTHCRSRIKRKWAKETEFHYYGVGQLESCKVYQKIEKVRGVVGGAARAGIQGDVYQTAHSLQLLSLSSPDYAPEVDRASSGAGDFEEISPEDLKEE